MTATMTIATTATDTFAGLVVSEQHNENTMKHRFFDIFYSALQNAVTRMNA
jgi:hypothetical protein